MPGITSYSSKLASVLAASEASPEEQQAAQVWHAFKTAAAADNIDVDQLSEEEQGALLRHYVEGDGESDDQYPENWSDEHIQAYESLEDDGEKRAFIQERETDLMGRYMARSLDDELGNLASDPSSNLSKLAGMMSDAKRGVGGLRRAGRAFREGLKQKGGGRLLQFDAAKRMAREGGKKLAPAAGAAAGLGAAGLGATALMKKRKKEASAVEALAMSRARDFLKHAGIDPDSGQPVESDEDAVNARAVEILQENGWGGLLED